MIKKKISPFLLNKYHLYEKAVQCTEADVDFLQATYKRYNKKAALKLREDFCGSASLLVDWVKASPKNIGVGIDLDPEPLSYFYAQHYSKLDESQQKRSLVFMRNVLSPGPFKADIICALNYSYKIFRSRKDILAYFRKARESLSPNGLFVLDSFGGFDAVMKGKESRNFRAFKRRYYYFWECYDYNPIKEEALYAISFSTRKTGRPTQPRLFKYHWRMWGLKQLEELLLEAGFKLVHHYFEGFTARGEGDGKYRRTEKVNEISSRVSMIVAQR